MLDRSGFIYLMYTAGLAYKIGMTVNPDRRRRQLEYWTGMPTKMLYCRRVEYMAEVEKEVLLHFKPKRLKKMFEWFHLDDSDIAAVPALIAEIDKKCIEKDRSQERIWNIMWGNPV